MKIWIVDDDELVHLLVKRIVSKGTFAVGLESFFNGKEALDQLTLIEDKAVLLPDLILLDINMPMYDGWYLIEKFETLKNKLMQKVKIYMFSSSIAPFDRTRADNSSLVADFIEKPITLEKFQQLIGA